MSALPEAKNSEELEFKWGKKRGVGKQQKNIRFYESFIYDGVEYNLYDCVYMYKEGEPEPYIGKLAKIWEYIDKWKKVKVHWFFRPSEISFYLKDEKVMGKELFLASGQGVGLSNINPLEAIAGKCKIVCVSKDSRNPKPSTEELQTADYLFYRTFNVESCTISDEIGDKVGDLEVKFIFNRKNQIETVSLDEKSIDSGAFEDRPSKRAKIDNPVDTSEDKDLSSIKSQIGNEAKRVKSEIGNEAKAPCKDVKIAEEADNLEDKPLKKLKIENAVKIPEIKNRNNNIQKLNTKSSGGMANDKIPSLMREEGEGEAHPKPHKCPIGSDRDLSMEKSNEKKTSKSSIGASSNEKKITRGEIVEVTRNSIGFRKEKTNEIKTNEKKTNKSSIGNEKKITRGEIVEVTRRPNPDKSTWFKELPWDDRIQSAQEDGKLVLLQNLDPEYTSAEVEDIIYHAFEESCTARMVQHTAVSSPHCGQALVIFRSKEAAERVIRRLRDGCLMLSNGRPLIGCVTKIPKSSGKQSTFVGHLFIDKLKHKMPKEMKEAVSTSHYSQPNTIEYEMAMDWFTLQARSDIWWKKLYQQQANEIEKLRGNLKLK